MSIYDNKFENIMIVSDIDRTFLSDESKVVKRNIERIEYFKKHGGLFTFATGRMKPNVKHLMNDVESIVNLPVITCNGACIYDFARDRVTEETFLDTDTALEMLSFVRASFPEVGVRMSIREGILAENSGNEYLTYDLGRCPKDAVRLAPFEKWGEYRMYKAVFRCDSSTLDSVREAIDSRFPRAFELSKSSSTFLEAQTYSLNKASIMKKMAADRSKATGIKMQVYAAGDYENDIEMLKAADVAVCPSNALDKVKAICDLCLCSNNEGVIADLIDILDK